jgi:hypothetical protein
MVQKGSGKFEVNEGGGSVVSGIVKVPENSSYQRASLEPHEPCHSDELLEFSSHDIYKELRYVDTIIRGLSVALSVWTVWVSVSIHY